MTVSGKDFGFTTRGLPENKIPGQRILIVAVGCGFVSLEAEVVAFYASGGDCSRSSERGVGWLSFLEAAEFAGGVELARVAVLVLKIGERRLALFGSVEGGDDGPS
jgi:hypothetical protein